MPEINGKEAFRVGWLRLCISQQFYKFILLECLLDVIALNQNYSFQNLCDIFEIQDVFVSF